MLMKLILVVMLILILIIDNTPCESLLSGCSSDRGTAQDSRRTTRARKPGAPAFDHHDDGDDLGCNIDDRGKLILNYLFTEGIQRERKHVFSNPTF